MSSLIDSKIATCKSWNDFEQLVAAHNKTKDKGDLFERLTQLFLQTSTTYTSKIKQVWWCNNPFTNEFPEQVRRNLNLPEGDEGIDLICETFEGKYWSVQAKYRTDNDKALTTKELSKFLSLSFVTSDKIELGLITHTSTKPVRKQDLMGQTTELGLQNFLEMSPEQWEQIAGICAENAPQPPPKRKPHPFQETAIAEAVTHFQTRDNARGKLIMPCGTGKSLMAYWMAREMDAKSIILAVPSLALIKQSLGDWTAEFLAEGIRPEWLAVCSDDSVGSMKEADSTVSTVYEAGIPATTDQLEIIEFLEKTTDAPKVIFTTYQSGQVLAEACTTAGFTADLLIADEAHKTVGSSAKKFATLLSDDNIHINKRLFMTATERVIRGSGEGEVVSMDDVSVYGEVFHQMSFAEAIREKIICDYKILTLFVSENETAHLVSEGQAVEVQQGNRKVETDAHSLAVGLAVEKAFKKYGIKRAITFHSSIKRAENFVAQQREFSGLVEEDIEIDYQTISSKQTAGQRSKRLHDFKSKDLALLSNARCLTEGVDIPSIDCVAFVDPKQSVVDIVQAAGRAMRRSEETGKEFGYILLPISVPEGASFEECAEATDFKAVSKVITALSTQDERIAEELNAETEAAGGGRIIIDSDTLDSPVLGLDDFSKNIKAEIWKSVGRANYLSFLEARLLVRKKRFPRAIEYREFASQHPNIPKFPETAYAEWISWPDWLGNQWLDYSEAQKIVSAMRIKGKVAYQKMDELPYGIPSTPETVYRDKGWTSWPAYLGTEISWLPFLKARKWSRAQKLGSRNEWMALSKSNQLPEGIPSNPNAKYANEGWAGWPDWLDHNKNHKKSFRSFSEAKEWTRQQNIGSLSQWSKLKKEGLRPDDIPAWPQDVYEEWVDWYDWFGKEKNKWLPFKEARKYARSLGLKNGTEWNKHHLEVKPEGIPRYPPREYEADFIDWPDWLGTSKSGSWQREEDPET